jgi:hypothetical protein
MRRAMVLGLAAAMALLAADAAFVKWWPGFRAAVATGDAKTVGDGVKFPLPWENGKIREIPSGADLAAHFDTYFTPEIKRIIATKSPEKLRNGLYMITWRAHGSEYAIHFKPAGARFVLDGLSEGPP